MVKLATIVGHVGGRCKGEYTEQLAWETAPASSSEIKARIKDHVASLFDFLDRERDRRPFDEVERGLRDWIFALARLFLAYFLARREETSQGEIEPWLRKGYSRRRRERKHLNTFFGRVTFWRTYVRRPGGTGLHPLDFALRLPADGFSPLVTEICARLSTLVSYEQVTALSLYFLSWSPSKTSVEKAVLGLGQHTQGWFEAAPPPEDDGEVLVIQFDSKATPTATEEELEKRRQKREKKKSALSPRHRGREKRARRVKRRRKKGDKSKNGKGAHLFVMYTLKRAMSPEGKPVLLGPRNRKVYGSYASKRHVFEAARREADKRGFPKGSGKLAQVVSDGDEDLERLTKEFFPDAIHTIDIMHVIEYLWDAAGCLFPEGSSELKEWAESMKKLLYEGATDALLSKVYNALRRPVRKRGGARSQAKRERLKTIHLYLAKRMDKMDYKSLRAQDLEIASGSIEGAVKHVIAKRFDNGSMRWIRERAEALLQLRCIEINGDWDAFMAFVERRLREQGRRDCRSQRLLSTRPPPLPAHGSASSNYLSADKHCA